LTRHKELRFGGSINLPWPEMLSINKHSTRKLLGRRAISFSLLSKVVTIPEIVVFYNA
jgi:hypothetical protein